MKVAVSKALELLQPDQVLPVLGSRHRERSCRHERHQLALQPEPVAGHQLPLRVVRRHGSASFSQSVRLHLLVQQWQCTETEPLRRLVHSS